MPNQNFNYYVGYTPSLSAAAIMAVLYGIMIIVHSVLGVLQKDRFFSASMAIGCFLELIGFIGRWRGHNDPTNLSAYSSSSFGLTVAPILFMAGIYNTFGESIPPYGEKYSVMKPKWYRRIFVVSDVISFGVQAAGGALTSIQAGNGSGGKTGTIIMTAALSFQVFSMTVFMGLVALFFWKVRRAKKAGTYEVDASDSAQDQDYEDLRHSSFFKAYIAAYMIATVLIYIRCFYRVVEMSEGFSGPTTDSEWWFMGFDMIPVVAGVVLVTVINPGIALRKGRFEKERKNSRDTL